MYFFPGASLPRGSVTVNHGASIAGTSRQDSNVAFAGAEIGDKPVISPAVVPAAGIIVVEAPTVTTAGSITVSVANISTATVAAGTAVVYNVSIIKSTGEDNVPPT